MVIGAEAEDATLMFKVYRLDSAIADALHGRLVSGDFEAAKDAMSKMPAIENQGKAALEAELSMMVKEGVVSKAGSTFEKVEVNRDFRDAGEVWEVVDGLEIESDIVIRKSGAVSANVAGTFACNAGSKIRLTEFYTQMEFPRDVPVLICRWQEKGENYICLGTASHNEAVDEDRDGYGNVYAGFVWVSNDSSVVSSATIATKRGQHSKIQVQEPFLYEPSEGAYMASGFGNMVEFRSDRAVTDALALSLKADHLEELGGTEKHGNGGRVAKVAKHSVEEDVTVGPGEKKRLSAEYSTLAGPSQVEGSINLDVQWVFIPVP